MTHFYPEDALQGQAKALEDVGLATQNNDRLHRTADGRLDLDFYLERGRNERALAAQQLFKAIGALAAKLTFGRLRRSRVSGRAVSGRGVHHA